jgi:hypothetical protein
MTLIVLLFAILYVNPQNVTLHVLNLKTLSVMLNAKNLNAKLNALIKVVKCLTALNVSLYVNNLTVSPIVKLLNPNANQFVKNPDVTGNVINPLALNPSVNLSVRTLTVFLKLNVALVLWELLELLNPSPSLKKPLRIKNVVNVNIKIKRSYLSNNIMNTV